MSQPIYQVDSFTNRPFAGNPAGVCILAQPREDAWMQNVACEMNLSETAFLLQQEDGYNLRWFTPAVEVDLCGHATLASAHILWETGTLPPDQQARFYTRSGLLTADRRGEWIEMDFPAKPEEPADAPDEVLEALSVPAKYIGRSQFDLLVELDSEDVVRAVKPNFGLLERVPVRGVIVTSRSDSGEYDFVSRFFAPAVGVNEDPVTGSAHCCLSPFWSKRLGRNELVGYQASARGGVVRVRLEGDRVRIGGQAVTVLKGELLGA
ncbi:MAG TPA: PhzF family phenazine biosynthesis protein [Ktedonobacteraceae bacterium]|jgi:predicted PhzF superfamily epimerase YddE/YHI9|nr:PhzF family phenazine biosynthesis protein [Ktedonobacteraceae bacterium]